jgi:formate hydrogenlyase subunit 3/multisubunit Na+/H+ antiporter MnhD subunit
MSEQRRETEFLRKCILYDDTTERHELEEKLTQAERNGRCVRRAVWLMALLATLAMAGLCYSAVFQAGDPRNLSHLTRPLLSQIFCALGLGSLISFAAFLGLGAIYQRQLNERREECRRLATKLMESRLQQTHPKPLPGPSPSETSRQETPCPSQT